MYTAALAGARAAFSVQKLGTTWKVTDTAAVPGTGEGSDTLVSIERLSFADKTFELVRPATEGTVGYGLADHFLFDPVFYLLGHPELVPSHTLASAWDQYQSAGAAANNAPNTFFDAAYYANRWSDLRGLNLDNSTLFGITTCTASGKDVRPDRSSISSTAPDTCPTTRMWPPMWTPTWPTFWAAAPTGAIAHFVIYGANEQRTAYDSAGQPIDMGYLL